MRPAFSIPYTLASLWAVCSAVPTTALDRRDVCIYGFTGGTWSCTAVFEDTKISGIEYNLYRYDDQVPADSPYIQYVKEVLNNISDLYTAFLGGANLGVSIHLVKQTDKSKPNVLASTNTNVVQCYVRMATEAEGALRAERPFKTTLAHEMYHCIQQHFLTGPFTPWQRDHRKWWAEGSAVFFSNYFYPDTDATVGHINYYDPSQPPYAEANQYPAGVIFQYLSNLGWSAEQVNAWVMKQTMSFTDSGEMSRIAADADLVSAWPGFAVAFVDKKITWKDGNPVRPFNDVAAVPFTVPEAEHSEQHITVYSFQIQRYTTSFAPDKTVTMIFTPGESKTILQYRKGSSGDYKKATPGDKIELQTSSSGGNPSCPSPGSTWEFIITSTSDPSSQSSNQAKLEFSVTSPAHPKRQDADECKQPDSCLIGSWSLDLDTMEDFLRSRLYEVQEVSIANLAVTGSSSLIIEDSFHSSMKFDPITISYDASSQGIGFHTDIAIRGAVEGTLIMGAQPSSFTWALGYLSSGSVKTMTHIPALNQDLPLDFPMDQQYNTETVVQYVCSGDSLQMTGYWQGGYVWAYTWKKAVA